MNPLARITCRLRALFHRDAIEAEMSAEMRQHVDDLVARLVAEGMPPEEARATAMRKFGGMDQIKERCRDERGWTWLENLRRDLRFSFRSLRRSPGFSAAVILTLALCIGANVTVLSVLYGLILKPLPFRQAGQLVEIYNTYPKAGRQKMPTNVSQYLDYKAHADLFEGLALWRVWTFNLGEESDPERGIGARVTGDFFPLLGVQPLLGRFFTLEESVPGKDFVVVLTQTCWETRYHADPAIIGKQIKLGGEQFTVIGVAPRSIEIFNKDAIILKPFEWTPAQADPVRRHSLTPLMYARVKPGVALSAAQAQVDAIDKQFYIQVAPPGVRTFIDQGGYRIALGQVRAEQTKSVRTALLLLQGGALFVLLLGCVNVANLMLARANARQAELAVRQALGAGRGTLARQLLTDSFLLTGIGAAIGMGLGWSSLRFINAYNADIVREAPPVAMDGAVLSIVLLAALAVAFFVGLLPGIRIWRTNLLGSMQSGARGSSGGAGERAAGGMLVTAQVALALVLLVGACLLIRSFSHIVAVDPGFNARQILHGRVALNATYDAAKSRAFFTQIVAKMREIPGVEAVGVSTNIPIGGQLSVVALPLRGANRGQDETFPSAAIMAVSPDYFSTMGIRIIEGRPFNAEDIAQKRQVFIVDRRFAEKYFPGRSAVGQEFDFGGPDQKPELRPVIIGVAEPVLFNGPEDRSGLPMVYGVMAASGGLSIELRTNRPMADVVPLMRAQLKSIDPTLPLYSVGTMQMAIDGSLRSRQGVMWLLGAFAGIALLLSAVGIYGMLAYDVTQRTREIGIRGAIGASRGQIVGLILRQGLWKTGLGLLIGLAGAFYLSRYMNSLLYDVKATDPLAFVGVSLLLLLVAVVASWLPARRAARIDPIIALRSE